MLFRPEGATQCLRQDHRSGDVVVLLQSDFVSAATCSWDVAPGYVVSAPWAGIPSVLAQRDLSARGPPGGRVMTRRAAAEPRHTNGIPRAIPTGARPSGSLDFALQTPRSRPLTPPKLASVACWIVPLTPGGPVSRDTIPFGYPRNQIPSVLRRSRVRGGNS